MLPGFFHCAYGNVFRSINIHTDLGKAFLEYSSKGLLVPDEASIQLWQIRNNKFSMKTFKPLVGDQQNSASSSSVYEGNQELSAVEMASIVVAKSSKKAPTFRSSDLSCREVEILLYVKDGRTNEQIAEHLGLSYHTVRAHLRRIYKKLNVNRRTEAIKGFFEYP